VPSLKLTWQRQGADVSDVIVSADSEATVGAIAEAILTRMPGSPGRPSRAATLAVARAGAWQVLPSGQKLRETGLANGAVITVMPADPVHTDPSRSQDRVVLQIVEGAPDLLHRTFRLRPGEHRVGRDPRGSIVIEDLEVSARHARIEVGSDVVIVDTNSTNGTFVNGGRISRRQIRPGDRIGLGDTVLEVKELLGGDSDSGAEVLFNRSPRLDPHYEGAEKEAPKPPSQPNGRRFPIIPMLVPLAMGAVLYLVTQSVYSLLFVAMSPLFVVGSYAEDRIASRRAFKQAEDEFRKELQELADELTKEAATEVARRRAEHPSTRELVDAARRRDALLWVRRPEHATFLDLRLGLGTQPSRTVVKLPHSTETTAELRKALHDFVARFANVEAVPVVAKLTDCGALGIAESAETRQPRVAASLIAQLVALHSPAELVLAAVVSKTESEGDWQWLKWLPHTSPYPYSPYTPLRSAQLTIGGTPTAALLSELDDVIAQRLAARQAERAQPAIVLLVTDDADPDERSHLVSIAERGREAGVYVIWVAPRVERLPGVCRTFIKVDGGTGASGVGYVDQPELLQPVAHEALAPHQAEEFARSLSPVVDHGAHAEDDSSLPLSVSFLDLAQAPFADSETAFWDKWAESGATTRKRRREPTLRALVGARGRGETFELDLVEHGPHALVGGTTGAGKSEFLQSWILGMATRYSPQRVTFLLVDYKGGSAFGPCSSLPHAVGLVTDLTAHLVTRVLRSLRAEIKKREELLEFHKVKDLPSLEQKKLEAAPPRLVIVVDEFAALSKEVPEFVDGMVDIAQRGRSLGLHLILATQRPTGVITENLKANTNLRVALRMADVQDSQDVLGAATAATFDPGIPGRAVAKTGPGRLVTFQAAYVGGRTTDDPPAPPIFIRSMPFSPEPLWEEPDDSDEAVVPEPGAPDVVRIVARAKDAFSGQKLPIRPWLDALKPPLDLTTILDTAREEIAEEAQRNGKPVPVSPIVFGRRDLPDSQSQPPAYFDPDASANLAILGTGGTGKTTLLRTLAIAVLAGDAGPCHIYGIDFGSRGLDLLEPLPHVARIEQGLDVDRVGTLLDLIRGIIAQRNQEFARVSVNSIGGYWRARNLNGDARWQVPRILLFIDGMTSFAQQYQAGVHPHFQSLARIAADGRKCGVHVVVTGDSGTAVPTGLMSAMQGRVVLRLASNDDYALLGVPPGVLEVTSPPGTGVVGKDVIQVATYGGDIDEAELRERIAALASRHPGVPRPRSIETWNDPVTVAELAQRARVDAPVIGRGQDLEPVAMVTKGYFLVTGATAADRLSALSVVAAGLQAWRPGAGLTYLGLRVPEASLGLAWGQAAVGAEEVRSRLGEVRAQAERPAGEIPWALVVADLPELFDAKLTDELTSVMDTAARNGHVVVVEGDAARVKDAAFAFVRSAGLVLKPDYTHGPLFSTFFQVDSRSWPNSRGILVTTDGSGHKPVQLAALG
jgi:S-DNA-T family DNA segregation ATPase FtsK/SpoIIIE